MLMIDKLEDRRLLAADSIFDQPLPPNVAPPLDPTQVLIGSIEAESTYLVADNLPAGSVLGNGLETTHDDLNPVAGVADMYVDAIDAALRAYNAVVDYGFVAVEGQGLHFQGPSASIAVVDPGARLESLLPRAPVDVLYMELDWTGDGVADAIIGDELPAGVAIDTPDGVLVTTHWDRAMGFTGLVSHFSFDDGDWRRAFLWDLDGDADTGGDQFSFTGNATITNVGNGLF